MKANKMLSLLLTTAMLLAVLPLGVWADSETGDFIYTLSNGEVTITRYTGEGGDVVIPSEIEGYPVTTIGNDAFFSNTSITNVTIPYGVTSIGDFAFGGCSALTRVTIPDSVTNIDLHAFCGTALTSILIPISVVNMGYGVFEMSNNLTDIYCEAEEQPESWNRYWFEVSANVHWGWKPYTSGDANGDGKINSADVSHLMRYFADLDYATGTSTVEIGDSADCNGDGVLDGRDVVRLLRYLANRDPLTGESDVELGK